MSLDASKAAAGGYCVASNRAMHFSGKNVAKAAEEVTELTTYRQAPRLRALVPVSTPRFSGSPIDAYVEMGRVTRAVCDTVGEDDRRCEEAKNLYAGIGAALLIGIGVVALAALFSE